MRASILIAAALLACTQAPAPKKRLIVLGVDGMDPVLLQQYMREGKTPNLAKLAAKGSFGKLGTSTPPQSPVAWSNFITGMLSEEHGIYDFVHRNPKDRSPYLSTSKTEEPKLMHVGDFVVPLGNAKVELLRVGEAFWEVLGEHGVPSTVFKIPANYPPKPSQLTNAVSGMGTPDLLGTYGTFQVYTNDRALSETKPSGGRMHFLPFDSYDRAKAQLTGPPNPLKSARALLTTPLSIAVDRKLQQAVVEVGDEVSILKVGEWSGWIPVHFELSTVLPNVSGMVLLHLKSISPKVVLYVSPINLDPTAPAQPISDEGPYLGDLAAQFGRFYTQGMPEDTKALEAGILSDAAFLQQAEIVFAERKRLFRWHLKNHKSGLLFFYFSSVDQISHVFWRALDPDAKPEVARYSNVIPDTYAKIDKLVGEAMATLDENTDLVVMSDHGFAPWKVKFHLNTWLKEMGYLHTYPDRPFVSGSWAHIDWSRTRAYAVGLNQLFVNLKGREPQGQVDQSDRDALVAELSEKLLAFRDPDTGAVTITAVHAPENPKHPDRAPELIVGYARGYRGSNESAVGEVPKKILEPNELKWSGDHCIDPKLVPGVMLSNRPLKIEGASLTDLGSTLIDYFDIVPPKQMRGARLFQGAKP